MELIAIVLISILVIILALLIGLCLIKFMDECLKNESPVDVESAKELRLRKLVKEREAMLLQQTQNNKLSPCRHPSGYHEEDPYRINLLLHPPPSKTQAKKLIQSLISPSSRPVEHPAHKNDGELPHFHFPGKYHEMMYCNNVEKKAFLLNFHFCFNPVTSDPFKGQTLATRF